MRRARFLAVAVFLGACGTSTTGGGKDGGGASLDLATVVDEGEPPDLAPVVEDLGGCPGGCEGGVCLGGVCCPSAALCGSACCLGGTTCLFDRCVVPGKACHTAGDCPTGQYCEPALGTPPTDDGGVPGDAGCTQPIAREGFCLPLPPTCGDGGAGGPDAGCLPACEYHPPAGAQLDGVVKWSWGPTASAYPAFTDVWSTPTVARIADANCDGKVDEQDPPNVVFVAGNVAPSNGPRNNGVLRVLDGRSGVEVWSLSAINASSMGFMGSSLALGDVDGDGRVDILAVTGEKFVAMIDASGAVRRVSDKPLPESISGWGGGLAIADMDRDGFPEIAFGPTVFSTKNGAITLAWTGAAGIGGGNTDEMLTTFADLDGDGNLELVAGNSAYRADGSLLWTTNLPNGFPAVGDLDRDGKPEVVLVSQTKTWILDGATGQTRLGPSTVAGSGSGGPPTIADFDGDGLPEIGVANANYYSVLKPDFVNGGINLLWKTRNHDFSSSVTGSSVFDFEGDGRAEVIYADECFLWVFDGPTGNVRFAASHTSFTATESPIVVDVDGDGRAEIVMVSNGASPVTWRCVDSQGAPTVVNGVTWVPGPANQAYRGVSVFGDAESSWVGTRTVWNEHTYHVSNICDDRDDACAPPNVYGAIPKGEKANWSVPWLDDFRQNVQDKGLFDAPDATVSLTVDCTDPPVVHPTVRNLGLAYLPAGVEVDVYATESQGPVLVGSAKTKNALAPGQVEQLTVTAQGGSMSKDIFTAEIVVDPNHPTFHECRADNDSSGPTTALCMMVQ